MVKAKELRRFAEPLITLSKEDNVANRRLVFNRTRSKAAVGKLFSDIGPRSIDRQGGYTRILKCGFRKGDSAPMAFIELVDRLELEGGDSSLGTNQESGQIDSEPDESVESEEEKK